jgi:hypothetical protein
VETVESQSQAFPRSHSPDDPSSSGARTTQTQEWAMEKWEIQARDSHFPTTPTLGGHSKPANEGRLKTGQRR